MLLLQIVATMQVFIEPYLLTGGGPENATVTVAYLMYQYAFNFSDFGGGGALGLMLMVVLVVFSAIYLRVSREEDPMRTLVSPLDAPDAPRGRLDLLDRPHARRRRLHARVRVPAVLDGDRRAEVPGRAGRRSRRASSRRSFDFGVYAEAWDQLDLGVFLTNTVLYAGGAWLFTLAVDVHGGVRAVEAPAGARQGGPRR